MKKWFQTDVDDRTLHKGSVRTKGLVQLTQELYEWLYLEAVKQSLQPDIDSAWGVTFKPVKQMTFNEIILLEATLPRVVYNWENEEIIGRNDILKTNIEAAIHVAHFGARYTDEGKIKFGALGEKIIKIPAQSAMYIPHALYQFGARSGKEQLKLTFKFGTEKFSKEINQSRPEVKKILV